MWVLGHPQAAYSALVTQNHLIEGRAFSRAAINRSRV